MRAIVTGATGGLGRNLVEYLQAKGWEVIAFGRNKEIGDTLGVEFHAFDLSDKDQTLKHFKSVDIVFHSAALSSPWGSYDMFYRANVLATHNVVDAINVYGIHKLVHVSTPSIYFDFTHQFSIKEDYLPKQFVNHYAQTKYEAEQVVLASDIESVIIRPRGIFGEYDSVLVPRLEKVAKKGAIPLIKNREVIVDVTYVGNVVHALYLAATRTVPNKSIFNITNDEPTNIKDLFEMLLASIGSDVTFKKLPYGLLMTAAKFMEISSKLGLSKEPLVTQYGVGVLGCSQTLDITAAKEQLGYQPVFTISEGLKRYAHYRNV